MEKHNFNTTDSPQVTLKVHGDLTVKGIDESQVIFRASPEGLVIEHEEERVSLEIPENCIVKVPYRAEVKVEAAHGNLIVKALEGSLRIEEVDGDLTLRNVSGTSVGRINGNLMAKSVEGAFEAETINGNAFARDVEGGFRIEDEIHGNLTLKDIEGGASVKANGNIDLRVDPAPNEVYSFEAGGNIFCRMPEDASTKVHVEEAATISVDFPEMKEQKTEAPWDITLGDGDATLNFSADGNVSISSQGPDWGTFPDFNFEIDADIDGMVTSITDQVSQQLDVQMQMMEQQLEAQLSRLDFSLGDKGLTDEQRQRIEQRAREASERAAERARERMRLAEEKLQRKVEAAQRKAERQARIAERQARAHEHRAHREHGSRSWSFSWPTPPTPPMPPTKVAEPASDEERLMILKMLEQKQISLEEAEELLSALEGK